MFVKNNIQNILCVMLYSEQEYLKNHLIVARHYLLTVFNILQIRLKYDLFKKQKNNFIESMIDFGRYIVYFLP